VNVNIPYCGAKNTKQVLDLYRPRQSASRTVPLVVYVHGGGWRQGDKKNAVLANYGSGILRSGFAIASVNYRLAPKAIYPSQPSDVSCALTYLRLHSSKYSLDTRRITLMGDSAGGQLVALQALKLQRPKTIASVVDLYGVNDLVAQIESSSKMSRNSRTFLGTADRTVAVAASPLTYANEFDAPPFLLIHGVNDHVVPITESRTFATALRLAGNKVTLTEVKHAGHAFGTASGGKPSVSELSQQIDSFIVSSYNSTSKTQQNLSQTN
jgi:acetyl esterase/lipase